MKPPARAGRLAPDARWPAVRRAIAAPRPGGLRPGLCGQQKTRRRLRVPGMSERTVQHDSRPHTPEDIERAGGPGFLAPGFLLAAPSHPSRTVASVPRSLPVTVAGAASDLHRLPLTHQRAAGATTNPSRRSNRNSPHRNSPQRNTEDHREERRPLCTSVLLCGERKPP